jgi:hypothetical protein
MSFKGSRYKQPHVDVECIWDSSMTKSLKNTSSDHETGEALAILVRRAEMEGVKPFKSLDDYAGEPELTDDFDVAEFVRQIREDRDRQSSQSL